MCPICTIFAATTLLGYVGTLTFGWCLPLLPATLQRRMALAFVTVTYTKGGGWQSVPPVTHHLAQASLAPQCPK